MTSYQLTPAYLSQQPPLPPNELHPLHPDVISRQATINIGAIGHVAHGKTTLVRAITSVNTIKFHSEVEKNITIKLGYANAKIFRCPTCKPPHNYFQAPSSAKDDTVCKVCKSPGTLVRHVSFVDCPGHDFYMATMLTGACVMDSAFLLISADQPCPQSQTQEHLLAIEIAGVCKSGGVIVVQNKIDLLPSEASAKTHKVNIVKFLSATQAAGSPIIPTSAISGYNVDLVLYYIVNYLKVPTRNLTLPPKFTVIRSFDVNKQGTDIENIKGGVAGGTLLQGMIRLGDLIEIRPGTVKVDEHTGRCQCYPLFTTVRSLYAENNELRYAIPGGLIAIGTDVDPSLTRQDRLVGSVIGHPDQLPPIRLNLKVVYELMHALIGQATLVTGATGLISDLQADEIVMLTIGSNAVTGTVKEIDTSCHPPQAKLAMARPICAENGEMIALSRKMNYGTSKSWRLIGWGRIQDDKEWDAFEG